MRRDPNVTYAVSSDGVDWDRVAVLVESLSPEDVVVAQSLAGIPIVDVDTARELLVGAVEALAELAEEGLIVSSGDDQELVDMLLASPIARVCNLRLVPLVDGQS